MGETQGSTYIKDKYQGKDKADWDVQSVTEEILNDIEGFVPTLH